MNKPKFTYTPEQLEYFRHCGQLGGLKSARIKLTPERIRKMQDGRKKANKQASNQLTVERMDEMTNKEVELTEACKAALELIKIARKYFPQSIHNDDRFSLELANSILTTALKVK